MIPESFFGDLDITTEKIMKLKTNYPIEAIPHSEYPRPNMVRSSYQTLNGYWDFTKTSRDNNDFEFDQKIKVPFSPESENSEIGGDFCLEDTQKLVYRRTFKIEEDTSPKRIILHFGAVDQICKVFVNGRLAGKHTGGYTPFEFDITDLVKDGDNTILVECIDTLEKSAGARGKQSRKPGGIWYTAQSGIWQSVWLECVPKDHVTDITIRTDAYKKEVLVKLETSAAISSSITVFDGERQIFSGDLENNEIAFCADFELWSPENPKLYDLEIKTDSGDIVRSYFGVRTFEIKEDKNGKKRLFLNSKPYFMNGVLDQGYWPDGLLTPPSAKAMEDELSLIKSMGFNMVRKHIKLEPQIWYHLCDKLGIIVWQDFVNGGGEYKFTHVAAFPFLGFHHNDGDLRYFSREDEGGRKEFLRSVHETVGALKNYTCIGVWVPFNEGWGQFNSYAVTKLVKKLDPTRVVDSVSGWHDQGALKTEIKSLHTYYTKLKVPKDERCVVLSEFGGYSLKTSGHVFNENKEFGYKKFKNQDELIKAIEELYVKKLIPLISQGLSAAVYTQLSDVEEEINGLVTYDRKIVKASVEKMKRINDLVNAESQKIL